MSTMNGNPHYGQALLLMDGVHNWRGSEGSTDATNIAAALDALVQAQLAVAFEQRTANLIACSQKVYIPDSPDDIKERMGHKGQGVGTPTPSKGDQQAAVEGVLVNELDRINYNGNTDRSYMLVDGDINVTGLAAKIVNKLRSGVGHA